MQGSMAKPGGRVVRMWGIGLTLLALTGCSTTPGGGFTLFPQGHRLLDAAKQLRSAYPEPLPLPRELDKRVLAPFVVEPGDVLLVQPVDLDSPVRLPGDQPVLPDGTINLGRYGRLVVAGKTLDEIEVLIREAVLAQPQAPGKDRDKDRDPGPISVRLITRQSKVYYVLGEVNAPGSFQLAGRETVLDAIVAAGGLTDRASPDKVILSRPTPPDGCRVVLPICYREIVQLGDTSTNYQVAPGDRIYVATRGFWESMCPSKEKNVCPPCGGPQVPCPIGEGCCGPANPAFGRPVLPPVTAPELVPAPAANLATPRPVD